MINSLQELFPKISVIDRRKTPSHGYRAVHVVVLLHGKSIEIQVRTSLQHLWAELSEKFADIIDPGIKYGEGIPQIQQVLRDTSELISILEEAEEKFLSHQEAVTRIKKRVAELLRELLSTLEK